MSNVRKILGYTLLLSACTLVGAACTNQKEQEPEEVVVEDKAIQKPDSAYVYTTDSNDSVILSKKIYYTYDAAGNQICIYDSSTISKYQWYKTEMKYDSRGNIIEHMSLNYKPDDAAWSKGAWWVYKYDNNNKMTSFAYYDHYTDTTKYSPLKKGAYSWLDDTHAECLAYNLFIGNTDDPWGLTEKIEYTYNEHGDVIKSISYNYLYNKSYELRYVIDYSYDKYYNVISHVVKEKDVVIFQEYNKYEYDSAGNILVRWYSSSTDETPPADPTAKYVYFY